MTVKWFLAGGQAKMPCAMSDYGVPFPMSSMLLPCTSTICQALSDWIFSVTAMTFEFLLAPHIFMVSLTGA
jgi:hypothetical protein